MIKTTIEKIKSAQLNKDLPQIRPGDTLKVHLRIKEGNKERIQIFEGIVIARKHGKGINATITVRKVVDGVGVERIFPIHSPAISKIEVIRSGKVRRSKLYFLRDAKGKRGKLKKKEYAMAIAEPKEAENIEEIQEPIETKTEEVTKEAIVQNEEPAKEEKLAE